MAGCAPQILHPPVDLRLRRVSLRHASGRRAGAATMASFAEVSRRAGTDDTRFSSVDDRLNQAAQKVPGLSNAAEDDPVSLRRPTFRIFSWISRCPFLALSMQQVAANGRKARHKAKAKIDPFYRATCTVRQTAAMSRKARLTTFFPPVNRRVVGSNPT
jgi:hypothetical protein